jgi:potassium channel subfamily K, other eukaryote
LDKTNDPEMMKIIKEKKGEIISVVSAFLIAIMLFSVQIFILPIPYCYIEGSRELDASIANERWNYLNCVYFCVSTLVTTGFGDFAPKTDLGRLYIMFYSFIGLIFYGFFVAFAGKYFLFIFDNILTIYVNFIKFSMNLCKEIKEGKSNENPTLKYVEILRLPLWKPMYLLFLIFVYMFFGAFLFSMLEGWSYFIGIYFCYMTLTTIGFGDILIKTNTSKVIFIIYALSGIFLVTLMVTMIIEGFMIISLPKPASPEVQITQKIEDPKEFTPSIPPKDSFEEIDLKDSNQ